MYYFFFSYSRDNNDEYLRAFYCDLDKAVRDKVGGDKLSFFDQSGNEPGDDWEENLESALSTSRVFIAMATASYCKKIYCGKEWAAFQDRLERYSNSANLPDRAPLAIPVLWVPPDERLAPFPDAIKSRHFHVGDPSSIPNQKGVAYLTRLKGVFKKEYEDLVSSLADRILDVAAEHEGIDVYQTVPKLASLESPFSAAGGLPERGAHHSGGPKHVHFVYGAATPDELRVAGRQALAAYGESGGSEWQPFFPNEQRAVGAVAAQVAGSDDIGMIPHEMPLSQDLDAQVRKCEANRQIVVLLIDSWTLRLAKYRQVITKFDQQNYVNCAVLIPWNDADEESNSFGAQLKTIVLDTLFHRSRNAGDLFFRNDIRGLAQLREQLADVLIRLRAEIINRNRPVAGALPPSGARPSISGPGSAT